MRKGYLDLVSRGLIRETGLNECEVGCEVLPAQLDPALAKAWEEGPPDRLRFECAPPGAIVPVRNLEELAMEVIGLREDVDRAGQRQAARSVARSIDEAAKPKKRRGLERLVMLFRGR